MKVSEATVPVALFVVLCMTLAMSTACDDETEGAPNNGSKKPRSKSEVVDDGTLEEMGPYGVISYVNESKFLGVMGSLGIGNYTVAQAQEVGAMFFYYNDGRIYSFPDPNLGGTDIEIYKIAEDDSLTLDDTFSTPGGAMPSDMLFVDNDTAYLSLYERGAVWKIDLATLEKTAEIDLTEYAVDDEDPDTPTDNSPNPSNLTIKDGMLYVTLSQSYNSQMMGREGMWVAVIDMETDTVEKIIEDRDRGFTFAGRFSGTGDATFVDEKGDLYVPAAGSWGWAEGQKSGFLRIKAKETEFDPDWALDFSEHELSVDGETVSADYLHFSLYAGDGIVYGSGHIPAFDSNPTDWVNDKNYALVKVDLYNRTMEALPLPATGAYSSDMAMDNDLLVAPLFTEKGAGVYVYDPASGTAVEEPVVETEGVVGFIKKLD